ncbi:FG-GAP repeat domain-containing protein [Desulfosudis oleivorans]|uniref:FG-GAP repeat protein n=1 Tax=Desulfosudis oleivorans (strain DSM 6200 / JCM 39069 / Hxd3) TaxID=96561 RepID=A9A0T6_DESOH|nr:VCBS repeat-containing protein [Desulfosudis oleivorans]ABW67561.1 FG-GAP repeat protein [Desulfosudis oleivorans Hxd3]
MTTQDKMAPNRQKGGACAGHLARGAMAASISGLVFLASPAHQAVAADNPFTLTFGKDNPLKAPIGLSDWQYAKPALVDIDGDGDIDIFIGGSYGGDGQGFVAYFENIGDADTPEFVKRIGTANPFYGLDLAEYAAPAFADVDGDGDMDALVGGDGDGGPGLAYFENTGTASAPVFTLQNGTANPFDAAASGYYNMAPTFADIDGDGDIDAIVGEKGEDGGYGYGSLHYFENVTTETDTMPVFDHFAPNNDANPFYQIMTNDDSYTTPAAFADIDNDGDIDLFGGENSSHISLLENLGTTPGPEGPTFTVYNLYDTENPFYMADVPYYYPAPAFADLDNDGDLDGIIGGGEGSLTFFENFGTNAAPVFAKRIGANSPFTGFDIGESSQPVFADIDGDGDMDMVSGGEINTNELGEGAVGGEIGQSLDFFENTGTTSAPVFEKRMGEDNPFDGVVTGEEDVAALVDIDGDGDLDLFAYSKYDDNAISFYKNTGSATNPVFEKQAEGNNPLFFVDAWLRGALQFVDIDGDGDMDAFTGRYGYTGGGVYFYENVGTETSPRFTPAGDNPLDMVLAGTSNSNVYSLAFADIDGDGDMDAIVGESSYNEGWVHGLRLYENTGSDTDPVFTLVEDDNTFDALADQEEPYYDLTPVFVDIDGDGDLDVFMGEESGRFLFFENHTNEPASGGGTTADDLGLSETDGDACFIDTTRSDTIPGVFTRAAKRVYDAVTALIR